MGTIGSVSCTFICVHGCHTAARLRANQSWLEPAKVQVETALPAARKTVGDIERPEPRVRGEEDAARGVEIDERRSGAGPPRVARLDGSTDIYGAPDDGQCRGLMIANDPAEGHVVAGQ